MGVRTSRSSWIVLIVGLGILGLEFAWARHWLGKVKERTQVILATVSQSRNKNS